MMNWSGLFRKEFRVTRTFLFAVIAFDIVMMIGIFVASERWEVPYLTAIVGGVLAFMHMFFLPIYLLISLNSEGRKLHLWLHNPQSGSRLIGAKVLNGLLALLISLVVVSVLSLIAFNLETADIVLPIDNVWLLGAYVLAVILAGALTMGIWVTFYWTAYQVLKTYIGRWALLVVLVLIGLISWFGGWFSGTRAGEALMDWGYVQFPSPLSMEVTQEAFEISTSTVPFPIGNVIFDTILLVVIFFVTSWLLDRKVEV
ncbi:hypothetical protein [Alkalihalobacillus sp. CinArs1]|uniref:hypothetical protein n=1 Tax=Alkalihalobacillus sp. CinArs1 TaxID=2995314 RepID=UPI0022DDFCD8|nr:hypothetical protein [Alkalihalobacillus sp. CinArs1]